MECTQFTISDRRRSYGLFRNVRSSILELNRQSRSLFANLHGLAVYLRFEGDGGLPEFPPPVSNDAAVEEIVREMTQFQPDRDALFTEHEDFPESHQPYTPGTTSFRYTMHVAPLVFAFPNTRFFTATGFEVGFGLHTVHRAGDIWNDLLTLIARKDRPENDHLIVTVGGPDRNGYSFPSEEFLANLACRLVRDAPKLNFLSKVWVHFWSNGRIIEIAPVRDSAVTQGFNGGLVPSHFTFKTPPQETEMTVPRVEREAKDC